MTNIFIVFQRLIINLAQFRRLLYTIHSQMLFTKLKPKLKYKLGTRKIRHKLSRVSLYIYNLIVKYLKAAEYSRTHFIDISLVYELWLYRQ